MPPLKKLPLLCVLALLVLATSAAALPSAFTKAGNPSLYNKLHTLAAENLLRQDKAHQKAYTKMLTDQDDVLMSYLLAYESDASLQIADPQDVLSNYLQIRTLLNTRGTTQDPEFFLSYVADQTVADERIQAYRAALLKDGLKAILDSSANEMELYRAVSQWCVARLKFQPTSGRDQSPLDITQKSIFGRCEEMQILFVAAARTVGLPSRPASTPWWPHQDNNHAWAEVWLDNAWHYTGDMESAYYADQTWFSGMIDKTVLILADGSLPSSNDEVLAKGRYDAVINSTRNYAGERTRNIKVLTVDEDGNSVAETALGIMVYNWGTLRPLTFVQCDADGKFSFSAGRGAFYLSAYKDSMQALVEVPSGSDTEMQLTITLSDSALPNQNELLDYPGNPFTWKQSPPEWDAGVALAKDKWTADDKFFSLRAYGKADSLMSAVVSNCRGNFNSWKGFLELVPTPPPAFLQYLLDGDVKYLWQASAQQFAALYSFWSSLDLSDVNATILQSLVNPAVFYEEISAPFKGRNKTWSLYPQCFVKKGDNDIDRLDKAMHWLKKSYRLNAGKSLQGLLPLDVAVKQKYLNGYQNRMLATALARANGIPAEFSRIPSLIEVYLDGDWKYYNLDKCAFDEGTGSESTGTCDLQVSVSDELGVPQKIAAEQLAVCRYAEGSFYQLNFTIDTPQKGVYELSLPSGDYYLQLGYRCSDAKTAFQMRHLDAVSADTLRVDFTLREYPHRWEPAYSDSLLSRLVAEVEKLDADCVLVGNFDQENSMRLAEKLKGLNQEFLWLGYQPDTSGLPNYQVSPQWKSLVQQDQRNRVRTLTLIKKNGVWQIYEGLWEHLSE